MELTNHFTQRMSQRGIPRELVDLAVTHGVDAQDKIVLGRKELRARLQELDDERRRLMKALDKGGLVVVASGDTLLTTYRCRRRRKS